MLEIDGKKEELIRENISLSDCDIAYCTLVEKILNEGARTNNRTGIDTISIPGWNYQFDLSKEFPIAETKDVKVKNCTSEIQWIHQVQSNKVNWLTDRENMIWNDWVVDEDGIYRVYEQGENAVYDPEKEVPLKYQRINPITGNLEKLPMLDKYNKQIMVKSKDVMEGKENPRTIKEAIWFGKEYAGTIGEAYGFINNLYKKPQCVEWTLKNNPNDRRMNIILWQDAHIAKAVLPSCVWSTEWKVTPDGKLNCYVHQRSADVPIGLPFNITQYAILLNMFAKSAGLKPGIMNYSIMDAHIYVNQIDGIKKQLKRYKYMTEYTSLLKNESEDTIQILYNKTKRLYDRLLIKAADVIDKDTSDMKFAKIKEELMSKDAKLAQEFENAYEEKTCLSHLLTRKQPKLELASHDSIFEYSTDYVSKNDPYLKENPIGNKELVLKNYTPTPFIKMPVAQ